MRYHSLWAMLRNSLNSKLKQNFETLKTECAVKKHHTVLTLTAAVCQLDVDIWSCSDCEFAIPALGKIDVWAKLTDVISSASVTACLSDCCSQLCIMSRLFSTSGDGNTFAADTAVLASFDLALVKLPSSGCSRANSVTEKQSNRKTRCTKLLHRRKQTEMQCCNVRTQSITTTFTQSV